MSIGWLLTEIVFLFYLVSNAAADNLRITTASNREVVSQNTLSAGVHISCTIEAYSIPLITWYNSSSILSHNSTDTVSAADNAVIRIHSTLTVVQTGVYYCTAAGDLGSIRSRDIRIELPEPPDFITPQKPGVTLRRNWSIILPCVSTQQSYYSVSWWFNGNQLPSQPSRYISHTGNLHVYEAGLQHDGSYHCSVFNQITSQSYTGPTLQLLVTTVNSSVNLDIINTLSPIQQPDTVYVHNNSDINLEYNTHYLPLYNITWMLPVQAESPMSPEISDIEMSSNYTVVVYTNDSVLMKESVDIQVRIVSLPAIEMNLPTTHYICDNNSITLSCDVTAAIPDITNVTWYYNSELVHTGLSLTLHTPVAGFYQCIAENEIGSAADYTLLLYPDALELNITAGSALLVTFGSLLNLHCRDVHGTVSTFSWTHAVTELSTTSQLYIPYVTSDHAGEYTCATRVCGSVSGNQTILISVTDPVISITQLFNSPYSVNISWPLHPRAVTYTLESQEGDDGNWNTLLSGEALYFIAQLQRGVSYKFRVSYTLQAAGGDNDTLLISTQDSIQLDYAPVITRITSLTSTQVLIHWEWEGDIRNVYSFVILYEQRDEIRNVTLLVTELDTTSDYLETTISELTPNTAYSFIVYGVESSEGAWNTPYSLTEYFTTLPAVLVTSPANLSVTYLPSSHSISVSYSLLRVAEQFGDILGYKIFLYYPNSPYNTTAYIQTATETSRTISLIRGFNSFYVHVLAFNLAGDGPASVAYFHLPPNATVSTYGMMPTSTTNSTITTINPLLSYLPYLIAIPTAILITCVVIVLVLIGKCLHMHHLNSIKEEAEGVRVKRYYQSHPMTTRNASNSKPSLQSEHKFVEHSKPSLTIPGRERTRAYQVASAVEATSVFQSNQKISSIGYRHILDADGQDVNLSLMSDIQAGKESGSVQSKPFKPEVKASTHSHEFSV